MMEDQKQQALENIELIKDIVLQTKRDMSLSGGGWIAIIWGIFCYVGILGEKLFHFSGPYEGLWWTILTVIGIFITYLFIKAKHKSRPHRHSQSVRWFFMFWIPLLILAYTLCLFCVFLPGLSRQYITIFILLVVSTGYLMLGFMLFKEILLMLMYTKLLSDTYLRACVGVFELLAMQKTSKKGGMSTFCGNLS